MIITVLDLEYSVKKGIISEMAVANVEDNFELSEVRSFLIDEKDKNGYIRNGKKVSEPFAKIHHYIKFRLCGKKNDVIVIGWDIEHDAKMLGRECINVSTSYINFRFFDLQKCYQSVYGLSNKISLSDAIKSLNIKDDFSFHAAKEDIKATVAVAKAICEHKRCTIGQLIENNPSCMGEVNLSKTKWSDSDDESQKRNSIDGFNISIDIPVLCLKKNIGPINISGVRDGICVYYNPILDKCYYGKDHPGKLSKASKSYLSNHSIFKQIEKRANNAAKLQKPDFYQADEDQSVSNYIVSLDMFAYIDEKKNMFNISTDYANLYKIGKKGGFAKAINQERLENQLLCFIKRIYNFKNFNKAILMGKKWSFGGKDAVISFSNLPKFRIADILKQKGAKVFIPREFSYALLSKVENSTVIACESRLMSYVKNDGVKKITEVTSRKDIKLITKDENGQLFAYIPFNANLINNIWGLMDEFPFVARIPFNDTLCQ